VIRVEEIDGEHQPVSYRTFAPVALAGVKTMPTSIADRAIPCPLQRKSKAEKTDKLRAKGARAHLHDLSRKLTRWAANAGGSLSDEPPIPDELGDREGDISVPLLAIAEQAGGNWPRRARDGLLEAFRQAEMVGGGKSQLLADIKAVFDGTDLDPQKPKSTDRLASETLCQRLAAIQTSPWGEYGKARKPITARQLARALQPFRIAPGTIRLADDKTPKGYFREKFRDAWSRYLDANDGSMPSEGVSDPTHRHARREASLFPGFPSATPGVDVADENPGKPASEADCADVADKTTHPGENEGDDAEGVVI